MELKTKHAAEQAVKRGAELSALLGAATANLNQELVDVQKKHGKTIAQYSLEISTIKTDLEAWSKANRKAEFADKQSVEFPCGVLTYRVGNRRLETLPRWTWKRVLAAVRLVKSLSRYLRVKVTLDKEKILADTAGDKPKLKLDRIAKVGMKVCQDETFDVEFRVETKLCKQT